MNYITLDFSGVKSLWQLHEYFKEVFELPDYYGRNMDALWDCLRCSFEEDTTIILKNLQSMPKDMHPIIPTIQELFQDLQNEEAEVTVNYSADNDSDISDYMIQNNIYLMLTTVNNVDMTDSSKTLELHSDH